jgi:GNAT superfamily N-acetyltransferase
LPIRIRAQGDLPGCVAVLRQVHEASGYPSKWPQDPARWLIPVGLESAWVAQEDGLIVGHVALVRGVRKQSLLQATGLTPSELGGISRLFVGLGSQRRGLARELLEAAAGHARKCGLQPVLDVVDDSTPAIALYERAGWKLAGTEIAPWSDPDGTSPTLRCYVAP